MKSANKPTNNSRRAAMYALVAAAGSFVLFLIASASHMPAAKFFTAISALLLSSLSLIILYHTKELLRNRSLWISIGAFSLLICTVLSLLLGYPSPNPLRQDNPFVTTQETRVPEFTIPGWETVPASTDSATNALDSTSAYDNNTPDRPDETESEL